MFEKGDEGVAVLVGGGEITDTATVPVVRAKDVQVLRAAWGGDELPFSTAYPAAPQRRMEAYRRFVHKEELGVGDGVEGDVFFSQSST